MSNALDEFGTRLADLEADFEFVSRAALLRPRLGDVVNWNADGEAIRVAQSFMDLRDSRVESVYGFLLVRLIAVFERYLRKMIEEKVTKIADETDEFGSLPQHIRSRNIALSGSLLASIDSPRSYVPLQPEVLASNLASCCAGATDFRLNALAFSAFIAGSSPSTLEKALTNVGVTGCWDKLGASASLATVLGTKGSRETGKRARERLEDLWRWRNNLAHGGDDEVALSEQQLRDCVSYIRAFSEALDVSVLPSARNRSRGGAGGSKGAKRRG